MHGIINTTRVSLVKRIHPDLFFFSTRTNIESNCGEMFFNVPAFQRSFVEESIYVEKRNVSSIRLGAPCC